jgi:hypothetical protein
MYCFTFSAKTNWVVFGVNERIFTNIAPIKVFKNIEASIG